MQSEVTRTSEVQAGLQCGSVVSAGQACRRPWVSSPALQEKKAGVGVGTRQDDKMEWVHEGLNECMSPQ